MEDIPEDERPAWAGAHDMVVAYEAGGRRSIVTPTVKRCLEHAYGGQTSSDKKVMDILAHFTFTKVYEPPTLATQTPTAANVFLIITCKDDSRISMRLKSGAINQTKLLEKLLKSDKISDEQKQKLCSGRNAKCATAWVKEYERLHKPTGEGESALAWHISRVGAWHTCVTSHEQSRDREQSPTAAARRLGLSVQRCAAVPDVLTSVSARILPVITHSR